MAIAVGFIPGCGPQIVTTSLYLNGAVPLSAQLGNAISNDGDALFPAIAKAPKAAALATLFSAVPAVIASAMVVFGVLCERYVIVIPGLTHPPEMFPGMELIGPGLREGIVDYTVSFAEIIQALGVLGAIGFLFMWGLKTFKLLPTEARALAQPSSVETPVT